MKKQVSQIVMFIGFLVVMLGTALDPLIFLPNVSGSADNAASSVIALSSVISVTGIISVLAIGFVNTQKKALVNIGFGLAALVGISGLITLIISGFTIASIGQMIMLVAAIIYAVLVIINFLGFNKGNGNNVVTDVPSVLNSYKEMVENEVITGDEFESLKAKVLSSAQVNTVNDLKRWKKLLDQKVITEEEFTAIKAKLFKV